jgi:hypothetical protein
VAVTIRMCTQCGERPASPRFARCTRCRRKPYPEGTRQYGRGARNGRDPAKVKRDSRASRLRAYGMTIADYDALFEEQDGRCAICRRTPEEAHMDASRLRVDHDHVTGAIRGLLCTGCNSGLGHLGDDPTRLRSAVEYLENRLPRP